MKITKNQLKHIIQEELEAVLAEQDPPRQRQKPKVKTVTTQGTLPPHTITVKDVVKDGVVWIIATATTKDGKFSAVGKKKLHRPSRRSLAEASAKARARHALLTKIPDSKNDE